MKKSSLITEGVSHHPNFKPHGFEGFKEEESTRYVGEQRWSLRRELSKK